MLRKVMSSLIFCFVFVGCQSKDSKDSKSKNPKTTDQTKSEENLTTISQLISYVESKKANLTYDKTDKYYKDSFNSAVGNVNSTWKTVQETDEIEDKEAKFVELSKSTFDKSIQNLEGNLLAGRCDGVISALKNITP